MDKYPTELWRFTARPGQAEKVYLVIDSSTEPSRWLEMSLLENKAGTWTTTTEIDPLQARMRYFTVNNGTYLNCGNVGLHAERYIERSMVA